LVVPAFVVTVVLNERRVAFRLTWKIALILVALVTTTLLTVTALPCTDTVAGLVKLIPLSITATEAPRPALLGEIDVKPGFANAGAVTLKD
jgi:hypothetical protein